ncbi:hypothetical protein B566_EDAN010355 [Ephemera danica]|nr:hypothetical protein B566_EDAN010355 [Ephemera danica]
MLNRHGCFVIERFDGDPWMEGRMRVTPYLGVFLYRPHRREHRRLPRAASKIYRYVNVTMAVAQRTFRGHAAGGLVACAKGGRRVGGRLQDETLLFSAGGVLHRMPVMEGAAAVIAPKNVKARSRAASLDAVPTQTHNGGAGVARDSEEAVSEGEGVARAAAALVSVKVDVDEKPLVFRGDGTTAAVKEEPAEQATSSGGASEDDDDAQAARQSGGSVKRRGEVSVSAGETLLKRARRDLEDSGPGDEEDERERMVRNFVDSASSEGPDEAARCAESLRSELNMLRALAEAKEREWNQLITNPTSQVIRLRALKEEMLLRLERRRAVLSLNEPRRAGTGSRQRPILPKPVVNGAPNSIIGEGRQGPIVDVRSIIADHRSRHPEAVPRRGRRLKPGATGGTSPAQTELSELGSLLNVLVKFAKMSQSDQHQQQQQQQQQTPPRLPYPEVTLHPVAPAPALGPASSLLQGILSKPGSAATPRATNFSPTLARLLTAPERPTPNSGTAASSSPGVSINDLLGPTKGRTEITITPVASQVTKPRGKASDVVMLDTEAGDDDDEDGEEREEGGDRLVIDEAESEVPSGRKHTQGSRRTAPVHLRKQLSNPVEEGEEEDEDEEEEVPECQGCHRNQAQFVCAGCGNQWYCSRECQVAAWDDHSEVCSG